MTGTPRRIRLSRAKGWRMPPNTVKVDRSTPWGNVFIVGRDGTAAECVQLYESLLAGYICITARASREEQRAARAYVVAHLSALQGKNLGCWCRDGAPCHGYPLLRAANPGLRCEAATNG
jgi:hypothetical protein